MAPPLQEIQNTSDQIRHSWDDWVPQDRVRKLTDENKELAAQLRNQMKQLQQKGPKSVTKKGGRTNGSDFSSARGSEERHASAAAQSGRGPRRNRDYDLETVSTLYISFCCSLHARMVLSRRCSALLVRGTHVRILFQLEILTAVIKTIQLPNRS